MRRRVCQLILPMVFAALVLGALSTASPAAAQGKSKKAKATREFNFEDDVIEATYLRPETSQVETLNTRKRASLIRIRMNFFAEIIRSAEDL